MSSVEPLFQPSELLSADVTTASQSPVHEMVNKAIKRYLVIKKIQPTCVAPTHAPLLILFLKI